MQSSLLKELADFRDLRKRNEEFQSNGWKESTGTFTTDFDIQSNEMIIKSFGSLREKLRSSQQENQNLREEITSLQIEISQVNQAATDLHGINQQLKEKNNHTQHALDQLKKKLVLMKQSLSEKIQLQQQLQFIKTNTVQLQLTVQQLEQQKKKVIEISIEDKLNIEQKINKLIFKGNNDEQYINQLENQLSKSKEIILKLQNQIKKLQIKYEEELFNKQWSKEHFQKDKYQIYIKQLQNQSHQLRNKHKKQKQKRGVLEQRVLELEEVAGLWTVKAQTFSGEVELMNKKVKKMERRMSQAKSSANKIANQKLNWEERFHRSVLISEELINRVKRELLGDIVELAKTCEFKINKLKDAKQTDLLRPSVGRQSCSVTKRLFKTDKKSIKSNEKYFHTSKHLMSQQYFQPPKGILTQSHTNLLNNNQKNYIQPLANPQEGNQQNNPHVDQNHSSLQQKIRRQRELMQKKLKEKMLYRKIQICPSPDKYKLREDYLKLILSK